MSQRGRGAHMRLPSPASELGFTRVRHLQWPKSDKSDFGWGRAKIRAPRLRLNIRPSIIEVLAQRRSAVFRLRQAAPLQLGHDQLDELADVVHGVKSAAQDEAAVGPGLVVQLLERI